MILHSLTREQYRTNIRPPQSEGFLTTPKKLGYFTWKHLKQQEDLQFSFYVLAISFFFSIIRTLSHDDLQTRIHEEQKTPIPAFIFVLSFGLYEFLIQSLYFVKFICKYKEIMAIDEDIMVDIKEIKNQLKFELIITPFLYSPIIGYYLISRGLIKNIRLAIKDSCSKVESDFLTMFLLLGLLSTFIIAIRTLKSLLCCCLTSYFNNNINNANNNANNNIKIIEELKTTSNYDDCSICLDEELQSELYQTDCGHNYHKQRITTWFDTSNLHKCPLCKSDVKEIQMIATDV